MHLALSLSSTALPSLLTSPPHFLFNTTNAIVLSNLLYDFLMQYTPLYVQSRTIISLPPPPYIHRESEVEVGVGEGCVCVCFG